MHKTHHKATEPQHLGKVTKPLPQDYKLLLNTITFNNNNNNSDNNVQEYPSWIWGHLDFPEVLSCNYLKCGSMQKQL